MSAIEIRRLTSADVALLDRIAADDADFDMDDCGGQETRLGEDDLRAFLEDPSVLYWVAEEPAAKGETSVLGFLHCQTIRKYGAQPMEVMLYAIGVRTAARRQGVGRAFVATMLAWMKERSIIEVWVLGDNPGAVSFYEACGFARHAPEDAVYLTRGLASV